MGVRISVKRNQWPELRQTTLIGALFSPSQSLTSDAQRPYLLPPTGGGKKKNYNVGKSNRITLVFWGNLDFAQPEHKRAAKLDAAIYAAYCINTQYLVCIQFSLIAISLLYSTAICTYLINKYAPDSSLLPKDARERATVDKVLSAITTIIQPRILQYYVSMPLLSYFALLFVGSCFKRPNVLRIATT